MSFDEEYLDEHHECRGEIHRLQVEVERLRAVGECNQKLMAQSGGRWGMRFIRLWPTDYVLRLGCMGSGKPIGIMQPTGSWLSANWRWWRIYRINRKRAAGGDGDGK